MTKSKILYFGCLGAPGHYLHDKTASRPRYEDTPWGTALDSGLLCKSEDYGRVDSNPDGKIVVARKDGWTALAFWDRSGDSRPGSNSAFLVKAEMCAMELLQGARDQWPEVFNRPKFPNLNLPSEEKQDVFFIEDGDDLGSLAHCRKSAHEYLDALLDGLKGGTTGDDGKETVVFSYRAMTKTEIDKLPTV